MKSKSKEKIVLSVETKERKRNPPRTAFREGNPYRVQPGQVLNPRGGKPKNEHRLVTRALAVDLARRATPNLTKALGLPSHASYAQCLSRALIRFAISGNLQAATLILNYLEGQPRQHLTIEDETSTDQSSRFELVFLESDGNGNLRPGDRAIDGHLADEPLALPEPD